VNTHNLGKMLHLAAKLLRREFESYAKHHRLTLPQWQVIAQLSRRDGLSQAALAGLVEVNPMTLSDIADRLEQNGLVRREPDPDDSRAKLVWITPAARKLTDEMRELATGVYEQALVGVDEDDRAALLRSLEKIIGNLTAASRAEEKEPA
jgi:DNA-binding MarR family transcriptional regulator